MEKSFLCDLSPLAITMAWHFKNEALFKHVQPWLEMVPDQRFISVITESNTFCTFMERYGKLVHLFYSTFCKLKYFSRLDVSCGKTWRLLSEFVGWSVRPSQDIRHRAQRTQRNGCVRDSDNLEIQDVFLFIIRNMFTCQLCLVHAYLH